MNNKALKYNIVSLFVFIIFLFIITTLSVHLANPPHYTIDKTAPVYTQTAYRIDKSKSLTINQFLAEPEKLKQHPFTDIKWGLASQDYWLKLDLENRQEKSVELTLHFDNPMIDFLSVYQVNEKQQVVKKLKLGDKVLGLSLFQYSTPHFMFRMQANEQTSLIIKIDTLGISKTPINIYGKAEFQDFLRSQSGVWGIFIGVLIMAALYNLVLFLGIRDRVYLIYIGYIISALLLMGSVLGFGFYLWPLPWQQFFNAQIVFSNYAMAFFTVAFCTMFLRYHKDNCRIYKLSVCFLVLLCGLGLISLFMPEYTSSKLFFAIMVPLYILCIYMIYRKLVSGFRWAKFYVLSWIPLVIGAAIQPLELTGFIPYSFEVRHVLLIAILCEIVLMAMALADRVRYQREKALYHATHTQQTELLNQAMLKQAYMAITSEHRIAKLCLVKIEQFNTLMSILKPSQLSQIVVTVAQSLENQIKKHRQFINLESSLGNTPKVADLGNGVLAFISTKIQSQAELHDELKNICKQLPKRYKLAGLDLQLYYRFSLAEPIADDGFDTWLQRGYLGLSQKLKNITPFSQHIEMDVSLAADLQQAMRSNTLSIYLQPIVNLRTGTIGGAEALLRWPTADQSLDIEQLIILAERTGLINELSLWVIEQACHTVALLNQQGYRDHTVSVNLSAKNLAIPNLIEKIENIILKYGITAEQLKFELTEFALIKNHDQMVSFISELNTLGSKVVLDDFGTGYSSLNYLVNYSFSTIKVDKSFIFDLVKNKTNQVIVKTAIDMAHNLDMNIIVEGIEDQATELMLIKMGADQGQGYYYSKAVPINEYLSFIATQFK